MVRENIRNTQTFKDLYFYIHFNVFCKRLQRINEKWLQNFNVFYRMFIRVYSYLTTSPSYYTCCILSYLKRHRLLRIQRNWPKIESFQARTLFLHGCHCNKLFMYFFWYRVYQNKGNLTLPCLRLLDNWFVEKHFTEKQKRAFSCLLIPFLYHYYTGKWVNTNRVKIAGRNRIFPPLRIGCKTVENKSIWI